MALSFYRRPEGDSIMNVKSWLRNLQAHVLESGKGERRATSSNASHRFRPRLEALEDRIVPSAGELDPTFGVGGKVVTDFQGPAYDTANAVVATQADGKVVV